MRLSFAYIYIGANYFSEHIFSQWNKTLHGTALFMVGGLYKGAGGKGKGTSDGRFILLANDSHLLFSSLLLVIVIPTRMDTFHVLNCWST